MLHSSFGWVPIHPYMSKGRVLFSCPSIALITLKALGILIIRLSESGGSDWQG